MNNITNFYLFREWLNLNEYVSSKEIRDKFNELGLNDDTTSLCNSIEEYVDLGFPSGTLWAKCNYGAKSETDFGEYYKFDEAMKLNVTLPTVEQFKELNKYTSSKWIKNYNNSGVNGRLFTSLINGKRIFIPAAGYCFNSSVNSVGSYGYVWSSSLYSSDPNNAHYLYFNSSNVYSQNYNNRCNGFSVRGVSQ